MVVCCVCKYSNYNDFCVGFVHFQKMEESQHTPAVLENLFWRPNMLFIPCRFFVGRNSSPLQINAIMHQMLNNLTYKFVHHPKVTCITNKVTTFNFLPSFLAFISCHLSTLSSITCIIKLHNPVSWHVLRCNSNSENAVALCKIVNTNRMQ